MREALAAYVESLWIEEFDGPFVTEMSLQDLEAFFDNATSDSMQRVSDIFAEASRFQREAGLPPVLADYNEARAKITDAWSDLFLSASLVGPSLSFFLFEEDLIVAYENANEAGSSAIDECPQFAPIVEFDIGANPFAPDFATPQPNSSG